MVLSVHEAADHLKPLRDHGLPVKSASADSHFAFDSLETRSWFADRPQGRAARDSLCVFLGDRSRAAFTCEGSEPPETHCISASRGTTAFVACDEFGGSDMERPNV